MISPTVVFAVLLGIVFVDAVDDRLRFLGGSRVVQIDQRFVVYILAQYGKILANGRHIIGYILIHNRLPLYLGFASKLNNSPAKKNRGLELIFAGIPAMHLTIIASG